MTVCVSQVQSCLDDGSWRELPKHERGSLSWLTKKPPMGWPPVMSQGCFHPPSLREERSWSGAKWHSGCAKWLQSPMLGAYRGIFSSPSIITELLVVGDSMAGQLHYAIALAVASNKRLSQLHISHARVSVIPKSVDGCLALMREQAHAQGFGLRDGRRHVVLFAVGTWYNLNSGDPTSACIGSTNLLTGSHTRICSRKARTAALPNHSAPASTVALPGFADPKRWMFQEMHYPWARRAQGSLGLEDLSEDLETLMTAFGRWQAELPFDVLAAEGMPQHWNAAPLNSSRACVVDTPSTYLPTAGLRSRTNDSRIWAKVRDACIRAAAHMPQARAVCEPRLSNESAVHNWRNVVAAAVLTRHNVTIVPLFSALRERGDLHRHTLSAGWDCTHYCEASEATQHMAKALLAVLAAKFGSCSIDAGGGVQEDQ